VLIVWKGGASRITLTNAETAGVIVGVGAAVALLVTLFFLPWLYRKLIKDDWQLHWYHIFLGPLLLKRGEIEPSPEDSDKIVQNYYRGHLTLAELNAQRKAEQAHANSPSTQSEDLESPDVVSKDGHVVSPAMLPEPAIGKEKTEEVVVDHQHSDYKPIVGPRPEGPIYSAAVLFWMFKKVFFHGVDQDIVGLQGDKNFLAGDLQAMHAHAAHYDNKVEYMYSFLQVMTAATASFTHGANDVSK
jgi:sodium-dependent phosphate transporter